MQVVLVLCMTKSHNYSYYKQQTFGWWDKDIEPIILCKMDTNKEPFDQPNMVGNVLTVVNNQSIYFYLFIKTSLKITSICEIGSFGLPDRAQCFQHWNHSFRLLLIWRMGLTNNTMLLMVISKPTNRGSQMKNWSAVTLLEHLQASFGLVKESWEIEDLSYACKIHNGVYTVFHLNMYIYIFSISFKAVSDLFTVLFILKVG